MALKNDIYYINWIKAAFVASLRSAMGIIASGTVGNTGGLSTSDTTIILGSPVSSGSFLVGDSIFIDKEILKINTINFSGGNISGFEVSRGQERTRARAYPRGTLIGKSGIPPQYVWLPDEENTKVQIYTAFPIRNFKAPTITVDARSGDASVSYIGPQEQLAEVTISGQGQHIYFSGILTLRVEIKIFAQTMTDAEKLLDYVVVLLRFILRDKLADLRLSYTSIDVGGIDTESINDQLLYVGTLTIGNVHSEYELVFPKEFLDYISKINILERVRSTIDESEIIVEAKVP